MAKGQSHDGSFLSHPYIISLKELIYVDMQKGRRGKLCSCNAEDTACVFVSGINYTMGISKVQKASGRTEMHLRLCGDLFEYSKLNCSPVLSVQF